jgi:hypothetical protein
METSAGGETLPSGNQFPRPVSWLAKRIPAHIYGLRSMVTHMSKTTVEIASPLLAQAKRLATARKTTLRALIESGLRQILDEDKHQGPFHLRDASFGQGGLSPEFKTGDWQQIRDAIYRGRGA